MDTQRHQRRRAIAAAALLVASVLLAGVGVVAAQNDTDYYDNDTGATNTSGWIPGDGTADAETILEMIARLPGMFIGTGGVDPSGAGYEGVLLTGLVIGASALFATVGIDVGPVAGSMLGMVVAYGLTTIGFIPQWIQPLLLFAVVGVPASVAILRVFRR